MLLHPPVSNNPQPKQLNHQDTGVFDSGARNIYFAKGSPIQNFNLDAPKVHVGTSTGQVQKYIGTGILGLPHLPDDFLRTRHVMPLLKHTLIRICSICDADCKQFSRKNILWSTDHNNNLSLQDGDNLMAQSYGALHYYHRLQTSLHHLPALQERPHKRSVPMSS